MYYLNVSSSALQVIDPRSVRDKTNNGFWVQCRSDMGPIDVHLIDRKPNALASNIATLERNNDETSTGGNGETDQNVGDALDSLIKETLTDTEAARLSPAKKVRTDPPEEEQQQVSLVC